MNFIHIFTYLSHVCLGAKGTYTKNNLKLGNTKTTNLGAK